VAASAVLASYHLARLCSVWPYNLELNFWYVFQLALFTQLKRIGKLFLKSFQKQFVT
jgi:hypothetical protein